MEFRRFQEEVARASGALAFLQTQHQSAVSMIAKSHNEQLKRAYLPGMSNGEKRVGIGFSQLRRPGPPMVTATPDGTGFRINGHVPWVTGLTFFPEFMIAGSMPDGRAVFGIVPFEPRPGITFSDPMRLAAMESCLTVTGDFHDWVMPAEMVVDIKPEGWITRNDQINITLQGFFALGCARGGIDVLWELQKKRGDSVISEAAIALQLEIDNCREAMIDAQACGSEETTDQKLQLRAWAIDLAMRCAHAAIAATGGAANALSHPAQRLMREALVYTVSAQTVPVRHATLRRLIRAEDPNLLS